MTTQAELEIEKQRTEGARVTFEFLKWLLAHGIVFRQCQENSDPMSAYLQEKGLSWSLPNAVEAYNELAKRGHKFVLDKLAPPVVAEEEAPPLPAYMPDVRTKKDIRNVPHEDFKRFMTGKDKKAWQARVEFVENRPETK
jgi:hypothetical protein